MLNQTNAIKPAVPERKIGLPVFVGLMILFILFIAISIAFGCHAKNSTNERSRYKKMQEYGSV